MSARIAQEPVSIAVTLSVAHQPTATHTLRPVQPVTPVSPDQKRKESRAFGRTLADHDSDDDKERSEDLPHASEPSIPPQTLFDVALISSESKTGAPAPQFNASGVRIDAYHRESERVVHEPIHRESPQQAESDI